jgi:hypothetical protein
VIAVVGAASNSAYAFCPNRMRERPLTLCNQLASPTSSYRTCRSMRSYCNHHRLPSLLYSSDKDQDESNASDSSSSSNSSGSDPIPAELLNEDEEDEVDDVIMQKLRRNARNGPTVNPMKEHDKMMKENQDEARNNTNSEIPMPISSNSTEPVDDSSVFNYLESSYLGIDIDETHHEGYLENQFRELLSRKGEKLTRLGPGIASLPLDPSSEEAKAEATLAQKESELQRATKAIGGKDKGKWNMDKLEEAQKLKAEIDQMHIDDCGAVLLANLAFYEAFSARDAEWMKEVWWSSPSTICVHPSHSPLIGSTAVLNSFKTLFENERKIKEVGRSPPVNIFMTPSNIRGLSVRGTTASLVCDEEIYDRSDDETPGRLIVNTFTTTNIFRKIGGKWKMTHRHASWHPETLAAEAGRKALPGFIKNERDRFNASLSGSLAKKRQRMKLKKLSGDGHSRRPAEHSSTSVPRSLEEIGTHGLLGIPDEDEPEPPKKPPSEEDEILRMLGIDVDSSDEDEGPKPKGLSLSDLLAGGKAGESTTTGSGTPEDPYIHRRIIHIGPEELQKLTSNRGESEGDYEDDDDDEENVVIDLRDKTDDEAKRIVSKLFFDAAMEKHEKLQKDGNSLKSASPEPSPLIEPRGNKSTVTQNCISAIRELSDQGQLSSKQKRILLTDIIASSAKGETSMVEVAYGLLADDNNAPGMDDFTEQCRIFAAASLDDNVFDD